MGAWCGCSSLRVCASNGAPHQSALPFQARSLGRRHPSIRTQEAGGRRGNRRSRGSRTPEREERTPTERGGIQGVLPLDTLFGYFEQKRLSRREQPGWTGARGGACQWQAPPHDRADRRDTAGPGGPQTSPSGREAGRREQARRDISGARESTPPAGARTGNP